MILTLKEKWGQLYFFRINFRPSSRSFASLRGRELIEPFGAAQGKKLIDPSLPKIGVRQAEVT